MSNTMGDSLFKLRRYSRVFLDIWAQIPISAPMLNQWAMGSFFSRKYSRRAHRDPQKFIFFITTSKWEKWWSRWLRMTNAFILCNLLWKVQKCPAGNREGSFKLSWDSHNVRTTWNTWIYLMQCCLNTYLGTYSLYPARRACWDICKYL